MAKAKTKQQLTIENQELQARLQELEDTLEAIRSGAVDAIVTSGPAGDRVYTLEGADHAYHTMVESMNEGAVTVLTDGTILYANRQFGQMTGAIPSDIVGRPFHDFVQTSDHPVWNGFIRQAGSDGLKAEIRLGAQSAFEIPVQISATPIDLGGTKALALVVTDLTESRRYEEIVAAERLSRYILEQSLEGVAVCINGRILFASRRLHEIYGGNPLMQPFDKIFPLRMSERETFSVEIPQSGKVVKGAEVSYRNPDGACYSLILNAGPLYGDNHKILGCLVSLTDITERKRAQDALRESEERFRNLSSIALEGIMIHESGIIVDTNQAFANLLDCVNPLELIGKPGMEMIRLTELSRKLLYDHMRTGATDTYELEIVKPDGTLLPVETSGRDIVWKERKARLVYMRDITERKRAEERLRDSENRFREMAETVPEILFTARPNGSMDYVNERGLDYAGLPAGEAMGDGWMKVVHPQDIERSLRSVAESFHTGQPYEVRQRLRAADGSYRWFLARARAIRNEKGKILKWFGSATDIHDMMQVEEALQESEARLRTLAEEMPHFVWEADADGTVLYANKRFYDFTGLTYEQTKAGGWLTAQHPDDAPAVEAAWLGALKGLGDYDVESRIRNGSTGEYRWFRIKGSPVTDNSGRIIRWVGTCTDIDDAKRSEEALHESERQLRQANELIEAVTKGTNVIIAAVDQGLRYTFFNRAYAEEIKRLTGKDIHVGSGIKELFAGMPAQMDIALKEWRRPLGGETVNKTIEFGDPGRYRRYYSSLQTALRDAHGNIIGAGEVGLDITDRVKTEKDLQDSEARFRLLSGTAGRLLATDDPQGLVQELCRDVMEYLDCQAFFNFMVDERAGKLRLNACAGIPEEEVRKLEWLDYGVAVCGCVARDGTRIVAEDIFHTPDARTQLVQSYGIQAYCCHPLKARDRLIGTLSFGTKTRARFTPEEVELMRIVAEQVAVAMQRIQAQHEIHESSQRLQLALDAGGMGMWAWDLQTNRTIWSPKEYELLGLPADEGGIDAEEFFRHVHPEDAPVLREALGEVIAHDSLFMREFRVVRADGQIRWLASVGRVIRSGSGQPLSVIGINYDATDRRKILEVLRESEERFRGVFEQSFSGIVLADFEGRILEVNPTFCHMLGYTERELVGRNILDLTHPEDREIEWAKSMELKEERLDGFRMEKRYLGKGGRVIWAEIGVSALHDDQGNIVYALGMAEDISERKAAEEALRRSKDELEERVRERTTELMMLLEDLEKGRDDLRKLASELVMAEERERKRIAVTLHDEVAQTLAAAKMRLDLLKKVTVGRDSIEVVDEARDLLMQSIRETRALMTDISSPILYEMGLPAAVQNLAEQTSASYGLAVSHDVTGEFGNLGQELVIMIYQAVRELLHNVSKHSQARNVSVRVIADDAGIRTIVADDGRGFEVSDVGLPRHEGGFGLFSIRERVKSFHGSMQIDSAPGEGTVVTVVLPSSVRQAQETRDEEKASPRGRRRRKT